MSDDKLRDFVLNKFFPEESTTPTPKVVMEEKVIVPPKVRKELDEESSTEDLIAQVVERELEKDDVEVGVDKEVVVKLCENVNEDIISEFFK